jgi:hypothetical protein
MGLDDSAVFTAAKGYIFTAPVGTAAPTPSDIDGFDPALTGNEVQTVTITGTPTGGTFTLTYAAQTTSGIAYNATAATVKTALEALSNIAVGDITSVTGGPGPATPYVVTFGGVLSGDIAQMTASAASLTGGTTPAVTVTTTTPGWAWVNLGHTSRDELPEFGFDGGDTETRGTWQNEALKQVITDPAVDFVTFNVHQFTEECLSLYYGVPNNSATVGVFSVAGASTAVTERALLIVIVDGSTKLGFYAGKTGIKREDAISIAVDEFAALPLRATFLKAGTSDLFSWISTDIAVNPA